MANEDTTTNELRERFHDFLEKNGFARPARWTSSGDYPSHHVQFLWLCWMEAHDGMKVVAVARRVGTLETTVDWIGDVPGDGDLLFARRN